MAKTQDELNQIKNEYESLNNKLKELSDDELQLVLGGITIEEYISNMKANAPYVRLLLASGGWFAIGLSIRRVSDGESFINTGFNNGIENGVKYTDYFFVSNANPNIKLVVHATDMGNGFYRNDDID